MTNYQDASEILRNMLGKDHSPAEVGYKTKSPPDESNHGQYVYASGKKNVSIKYTEDEGSTYIILSGHNGRSKVRTTFRADQFSIEDIVQRIEKKLDISFTHR